tara:strand:- start:956 stop:1135 length:180 start_codon:yes stop_codon:yes gene_type:complete
MLSERIEPTSQGLTLPERDALMGNSKHKNRDTLHEMLTIVKEIKTDLKELKHYMHGENK